MGFALFRRRQGEAYISGCGPKKALATQPWLMQYEAEALRSPRQLDRLKNFGQFVRHFEHRVMSASKFLRDPAGIGLGALVDRIEGR